MLRIEIAQHTMCSDNDRATTAVVRRAERTDCTGSSWRALAAKAGRAEGHSYGRSFGSFLSAGWEFACSLLCAGNRSHSVVNSRHFELRDIAARILMRRDKPRRTTLQI